MESATAPVSSPAPPGDTLRVAMLRSMLRAKLHMARVTEANLEYMGSLTVDRDLMDAVGVAGLARLRRFPELFTRLIFPLASGVNSRS